MYVHLNSDQYSKDHLNALITNHTSRLKTVISRFTQRFHSEGQQQYDILNNDSYWTKSIPHEYSGPCFTYNPQLDSDPGYWYSMSIVPNAAAAPMYENMRIFLHEPNKFFYFMEEEAPNTVALDLKQLQHIKKTQIDGKFDNFDDSMY